MSYRKMLTRILIILLLAAAGCNSKVTESLPESPELTPGEFSGKLASEVVVLDVRTPGEFSGGSISGATNVDFKDPGFKEKILALDKSKTYLVYCASGARSDKAAEWMKQENFQKVYTLKGGIRAWEESGFPVGK